MTPGGQGGRHVARAANDRHRILRRGRVALALAALAGFSACSPADGSGPAAAEAPAASGAAAASSVSPGPGPAWRKPAAEELRRRLSPLQFAVTQQDATEPPFRNEYWDNHAAGLYVDVVSGEPLFASIDKFDSGTGWPSFTKPLSDAAVTTRTDWKLVLPRTEVRSATAGSHLGHVFDDGPAPTGKRFCMNSAALRFVPVDRLEAEGYAAWLPLFAKADTPASAAGAAGPKPSEASAAAGAIVPSQAGDAAAPGRAALPRENPPRPTPPDR